MAVALFGLTLAAFMPALSCDFVNYDDPDYVTKNLHVKAGLNPTQTIWAFTTFQNANWHPLTWLSLLLDSSVWGINSTGFHLTNVLVHAANAALLFLALRALTGAFWRSAIVALLFAVHPLRAESVAWISERKDVLGAFFGFLALLAYANYVRRRTRSRYLAVVVAFALSLLCKPMLVTLPCLFLVLDWWPLRRMAGGNTMATGLVAGAASMPGASNRNHGKAKKGESAVSPAGTSIPVKPEAVKTGTQLEGNDSHSPGTPARAWLRLVLEKLPLFALVIASSVVTYVAQREQYAVGSVQRFPLPLRTENAVVSYAIYLWKSAWPTNLAVYYPHPIYDVDAGGVLSADKVGGAALLLVALTVSAFVLRKRAPYLLTGWLWYLGTLVPVIGLVQVGSQAYADRYTYFPQIGLLLALCWGVADLAASRARIALAAGAAAALVLAAGTWNQLAFWKNSIVLWRHAIKATYSTATGEINLGVALEDVHANAEAFQCYQRALKYDPTNARAHINMANMLAIQRQFDLAALHLEEANRLVPGQAETLCNLGRIESARDNIPRARDLLEQALKLKEDYLEAHLVLGLILLQQRQLIDSRDHLREATRIDPGSAPAHDAYGAVLQELGDRENATREFEMAVKLNPKADLYQMHLRAIRFSPGRPAPAPRQ
jgi:protein O-mannosyl-transferase